MNSNISEELLIPMETISDKLWKQTKLGPPGILEIKLKKLYNFFLIQLPVELRKVKVVWGN